ncbi:upstream activation factor subunit UAF30-like [Cucumis melo var. makuwa]|uniref:Upstream activation factor subunit UAF30-like n=1 Tax=Cucumis melo var. makuwa TaxID=1194695 RepID=A0A5A7TVG9_CUCMM|nr:upstream activation factor subunit UAF30-like [Cucumis melo var. makuwa]
MVSDSELIGRLRDFLRNSDLNTTTTAIVRRKLEEDFGIDLSDKKRFIREQVDLFLQTEHEKAVEEGYGHCEEVEQEDGDENLKMETEDGDSEDGDNDDEDDEKGKTSSDKAKKRGGGFSKLCSLSPQLQEFIGATEMARTEVVKQLWNHIRENNLQDPSNRRNILCDEPLKALFGVNSINMFQMNKALSKHIWPLESNDDSDDSAREDKRQKKGKSGFLAPLPLSDALVAFLGTGEDALPRSDVVKRMWDYIKQNNLQNGKSGGGNMRVDVVLLLCKVAKVKTKSNLCWWNKELFRNIHPQMVDLSNSIDDLSNYKMDCEEIYEETKAYKNVAKTEEVLGSLPSLLTSDCAHRNEVKHLVPKHTVNIQHRGIFAYFTCVAYGVLPLVQPFSNPILYLDVALDFQQPTKIESIKTRLFFMGVYTLSFHKNLKRASDNILSLSTQEYQMKVGSECPGQPLRSSP